MTPAGDLAASGRAPRSYALLFDSGWRAAAYCLHARVILYSLLPLVLMVALAFGSAWLFWEDAMDAVAEAMRSWHVAAQLKQWLANLGLTGVMAALPLLVVLVLATPVIVILSLLAVATLMTPAMVGLVSKRRFPALVQKRGGTFVHSVVGGLGATAVALLAMVVSMPLWLIPPLVAVLPPLIWGWLTYRVMTYDVLADHASKDERRELVRRHRPYLMAMGVITGYLGAAPSLVWASSLLFIVAAPLLIPVAIWIYTLVFAFSSLWFAHYGLSALQALRAERGFDDALDGPITAPGAASLPPLLPPL